MCDRACLLRLQSLSLRSRGRLSLSPRLIGPPLTIQIRIQSTFLLSAPLGSRLTISGGFRLAVRALLPPELCATLFFLIRDRGSMQEVETGLNSANSPYARDQLKAYTLALSITAAYPFKAMGSGRITWSASCSLRQAVEANERRSLVNSCAEAWSGK